MTMPTAGHISCQEVVRVMWEYLDGELDAERRARIREHLEICPHCREQFTFEGAFLRAVARHLDEAGDTDALRFRIEQALSSYDADNS